MLMHCERPPRPEILVVDEANGFHVSRSHGWLSTHLYEDASQLIVDRFKVGDVNYIVNRALSGTYDPPIGGLKGRFVVRELMDLKGLMDDLDFIGRGRSPNHAMRDWQRQIDTAIQRLFAKQDFERNESEQKLWRCLGRYFDLNAIRYSAPLRIRSLGILESVRGHRYTIRWIDTGGVTRLGRNQIPSQMVSYRLGQPFEAVVLRNARDWKLIRIESAFAQRSLPSDQSKEAAKLLSPQVDRERKYVDWD